MNNAIQEYSLIKEMADYLKEKAGDFVPSVLAILGSGLGNYVKSESVRIVKEIAYSEILIVDEYWPEYDRDFLANAVIEFHRRNRRWGK